MWTLYGHYTTNGTLYGQKLNFVLLKENSVDYRTDGTIKDDLFLIRICILVVLLIQKVLGLMA